MRPLGKLRARLEARRAARAGRGPAIGQRLSPAELAAEERAEDLLGSVVGADALAAYRVLGFLFVFGGTEADGMPGYGYLIYPHRPIVSFDSRTREPLNELCVSFPDRSGAGAPERLPDADDVLAKWMALRGDELALLAEANIDRPGTQVDPGQARRDILRLQEWADPGDAGASDGSDGPGLATAQ